MDTNWAETAIKAAWKGYSTVATGDARVFRAAARGQEREIIGAWSKWLHATYAEDLPETVHSLIYTRAWDLGHSAGLNDVERHYEELADLASAIRDVYASEKNA